jgi:hypothetical protein
VGGQWRGDDAPYVFATDDYGARWTPLAGTLPHGEVALVIREHPHNPDLLLLGTERGLWASWSRGARWAKLRLGLPPARVHDLQIHPRDNDLIVGTHGRGMFVLDSLAGLAGMTGTALERPLTVFAPRETAMWRLFNHRTNIGPGHRLFIGANPVEGAPIDYVLRTPATTPARIEIADGSGRVISTLEGPAARGLNRVHWNLRHAMPFPLPEGIRPDPPGQPGGPRMRALALAQGPFVMPGAYRITVVAGHARERGATSASGRLAQALEPVGRRKRAGDTDRRVIDSGDGPAGAARATTWSCRRRASEVRRVAALAPDGDCWCDAWQRGLS